MSVDEINSWFARNTFRGQFSIRQMSDRELSDARQEILATENMLDQYARQSQVTASDRAIGNIGYGVSLFGLGALFIASLSPVAPVLTVTGAAITAYQMIRDRRKALEAEWCETKFGELLRFSKDIEEELRRRSA